MAQGPLEIIVHRAASSVVIELAGELHADDALTLGHALPRGPIDAVLRCDRLDAIDAAGLGVLAAWADDVLGAGGTVGVRTTSAALEQFARGAGAPDGRSLVAAHGVERATS